MEKAAVAEHELKEFDEVVASLNPDDVFHAILKATSAANRSLLCSNLLGPAPVMAMIGLLIDMLIEMDVPLAQIRNVLVDMTAEPGSARHWAQELAAELTAQRQRQQQQTEAQR